jgi:Flp pilus assembly protein TadG
MMQRHASRLFSIRRTSRAWLDEEGGLAAAEMALILPVALLIMSLIVFGGQAFGVQRKVTLAATTVADIFAQANNNGLATITAAELNQILSYPNLILYPYDASAVQVRVSQLLVTTQNGATTGTVQGSWPNSNWTARTTGTQLLVDPSIAAAFTCATPPNAPTAMSSSARSNIHFSRPAYTCRWDHSPCMIRS